MQVKLLKATPDAERLVYQCARQSRFQDSVADLDVGSISKKKIKELLLKLLEWGHYGPFEHPQFSFGIGGVSRSFTHQLVRHRLATFDQQSLRYVDKAKQGEFAVVIPPLISKNSKLAKEFKKHGRACFELYKKLRRQGINPEDARFCLPIGTATAITVSWNARSIMHFLLLRKSPAAQWEIRKVAQNVLRIMKGEMPITFTWFEENMDNMKPAP